MLNKYMYDFYICGPMRGYERLNFDMFEWAAMVLRSKGAMVWNPSEHMSYPERTIEECLTEDLNAILNECRCIATLPGWRKSVGANVEVFAGSVCGKKIYEIQACDTRNGFVLKMVDASIFYLPYDNVFSPKLIIGNK